MADEKTASSTRAFFQWMLHWVRNILIADLLICLGVLGGCWLMGARDTTSLINGIFMVGVLCVIAGTASGGFGMLQRGDQKYQLAQSTSVMSIHERSQQAMDDVNQAYGFMIQAILTGGIAIAISLLIWNVLGQKTF